MKFPSFLSGLRAPIGLDVSGRWIKAAQLKGGHGAPRLTAGVRLTRHDPAAAFSEADAQLLASVLDRAGFEGRRVVLAAPRELLMTDVLELPPRSSGAPIEQLARMELARANRCDPATFEMGLWDIPTSGRAGEGNSVFATALPHDRAEPLIAVLRSVGLEVTTIDTPGCAMARASLSHAAVGSSDKPGLTALLDVGWLAALLVVVSNGIVVYERSIAEAGLSRLYAALRARLGLEHDAADLVLCSPAPGRQQDQSPRALSSEARACLTEFLDALAPEAQRSLSYTSHRYQGWELTSLLLTGDGAELAGLSERLATAVAVPVSKVQLPETMTIPASPATPPLSLITAIGASQHALADAAARRAAA